MYILSICIKLVVFCKCDFNVLFVGDYKYIFGG